MDTCYQSFRTAAATLALAAAAACPLPAQLVIDFDDLQNPFSNGTVSGDHSFSGGSSLFLGAGGINDVASFDLPAEYLGKDLLITMQVLDLGRWVDSTVTGAPASVYGPRWGVGSGPLGSEYVAAGLLHRSSLQSRDRYAAHLPTVPGDNLYGSWFTPVSYEGAERAILSADGGSHNGTSWVPGTPDVNGAWTEWSFVISAAGDVELSLDGYDAVSATLASPVTGIYLHGGRTISDAALAGVYFDSITVTAVPEPGTVGAIAGAMALASAAFARSRRTRQS